MDLQDGVRMEGIQLLPAFVLNFYLVSLAICPAIVDTHKWRWGATCTNQGSVVDAKGDGLEEFPCPLGRWISYENNENAVMLETSLSV